MRNILHKALSEHLTQFIHDREQLNTLYTTFKEQEESTAEAISMYANLIYNYGIHEDCHLSKINAPTVIGIGLTLNSLANDLTLAQYGRDFTSISLDRLSVPQGEENE
ncbi:hypothetical protein BKK52_07585 [Rodentibacter trehalosifermentans]|uniref:Uncharacterized protein n=1 Tax=Rodentibacter trehalosifermentans TaxID=1908263 RepID=A0A1V3J0F1_9PAST|nr:hypothetical protein [Rodentibacter trehalosifermentans]OOF47919.1 hypothetical protein BKK52_07585 [Rodentibacter trehalosifermentans]